MARKAKDAPVARLRPAAKQGEVPRVVIIVAAVLGAGGLAAKLELDRRAARARAERDRAYRLHAGEPAAAGISRIARGQIEGSIDRLEHHGSGDAIDAVHATRKSLKRVRAAVRLVRDELGAERYEAENAFFRDTARRLSAARDSEVMVDTLEGLQQRHADLAPHAWTPFHRTLVEERCRAQERLRHDGKALDRVLDDLRGARERPGTWSLEDSGFHAVAAGLERIYRRGRRELRAARRLRSGEALHEWRKSVKYLRHSVEILQPVESKRLGRLARDARQLGDVLGDEHDLAVLRTLACERPLCFTESDSLESLLELIDRRRARLRKRAFKLGRRIYHDKPGRFVRGVERRWHLSAKAGVKR